MVDAQVTAVLVTDLVASTGLLDRLGDDAAHEASVQHFSLLRSTVADHGGREVKNTGTGLMVEFHSVVAAVKCAIDMQRRASHHPLGRRLRIGIEAGEHVRDGDDLFGTGVVVAERLCDLAGGQHIITTDLVSRLVGTRVDASFTPLGSVPLKGLAARVEVFAVTWDAPATEKSRAVDPPAITVVIADDQRLVRGGLRVILDSEPGIVVVGEAGNGLEAIELVRRHSPSVALLDIRMPNMDGLVAARHILVESPASRILILTTFDADEYVFEALRAGASGFLLKDAPPDQLVGAVRSIAAGDALIDPSVTRRLISRFAKAARPPGATPDSLRHLTARELDVLRQVARGLSNIEIAQELVVEENTVKTHVGRILMKLGLRDRVQAVVFAYECGFVVPDRP
jgi:DNA-binding NarL/FixJ family response regulator/class 3 adenylate cyclase